MNLIHIAGHLAADPETRVTQTGKKVTTFRVGVKTRHKNADDTIWYRVTVWDDQFSYMMPHLKKGSSILVCGELRKPELFNDREGKPQISLEISARDLQFSPFGKPGGSAEAKPAAAAVSSSANSYGMGAAPTGTSSGAGATFDDEVPF
jgi:single-strand DNA-binding protein